MRILSFILFFSFILSFTSCKKSPERFETDFGGIFDTVVTLVGYCNSKNEFENISDDIKEKFQFYHQLFDIYNEYDGFNNLKTINKNAGIKPIKVNEEIISLLELSIEWHEKTKGSFNIAFGSVLKLWHEWRENKIPPSDIELKNASKYTNIENIIINKNEKTVFLSNYYMSIDIGAAAKGYACELIKKYAIQKGYKNLLINAGGNVVTIGQKPDRSSGNTSWSVAICNPNNPIEILHKIRADNGKCVVSSGGYERFYEIDNIKYHHIIDPDTLHPANIFSGVSVVYSDSGIADIMSTALFVMTLKEGKQLVESIPDMEAVWIYANGEEEFSSGFNLFQQ